jgi:ADP-heptose:LPS heptosyltransferase
VFPLALGRAEGGVPHGEFVLASPLAGWRSKQWPMDHYRELASRLRTLGVPLVLNGPPAARRGRPVAKECSGLTAGPTKKQSGT